MNHKITKQTAITLGNFDSFHRGHRKLIDFTKDYAEKHSLLSIIFTTTPSTAEFFGKTEKKILENKREIVYTNQNLCDIFIEHPLSIQFLNTEPKQFLQMLKNELKAEAIIVGENYRFGKGAKGTPILIEEFSKENGIYFKVIDLLKENGEIISSTAIREAISTGDIKKANNFLGYPFFIKGEVVPTDGRGAQIGFATANINLKEELISPDHGVYLTKTTLPSGERFKSVTNIGTKPTFNVEVPQIETHILDTCIDLYHKEIKVEFYKKIRSIVKFDSIEALKRQLKEDVRIANESDFL